MANPTGKGGVRFKPGVSGNPGGLSKEARAAKKLKETTYQDFIESLQHLGSLTREQLKEIVSNPKTPVFKLIFARVLFDAQNGKIESQKILFDRLWGKVKEQDPIQSPGNGLPQIVITIPDNGREVKSVGRNSTVEDKKNDG